MTARILLCLLLASRAGALEAPPITRSERQSLTGFEELRFLGWGEACELALSFLRYPPLGEGLQGLPAEWRIGTLAIPPGGGRTVEDWGYRSDGSAEWSAAEAGAETDALSKDGFTKPGFVENVRDARVADKPGLSELLLTTAPFETAHPVRWPPPPHVLARIHYSPLGTCALFIFKDRGSAKDSYRTVLARLKDPGVRRRRSRGHVNNGLLLFEDSDLYGAQEELAIAAAADPAYGAARYHHAALLTALGQDDEALAELKAATAANPAYAARARKAQEFSGLRRDQRFLAIVEPKPKGQR